MPVPVDTIDDEILYILGLWVQNNNQAITGTIGQNVVWNLAQFIKKNPENWNKAKVISTVTNYTTQSTECILIFTNNSSGSINFGNNIWNKWYFINATDNARGIPGGKFYYDINGDAITSISARDAVHIAKGDDDFWYQINPGSADSGSKPPLIKICTEDGSGGTPIAGSSIYENSALIGLGATNGNKFQMVLNGIILENYGDNPGFIYTDPDNGIVDISPVGTFQLGNGLYVNLNQ